MFERAQTPHILQARPVSGDLTNTGLQETEISIPKGSVGGVFEKTLFSHIPQTRIQTLEIGIGAYIWGDAATDIIFTAYLKDSRGTTVALTDPITTINAPAEWSDSCLSGYVDTESTPLYTPLTLTVKGLNQDAEGTKFKLNNGTYVEAVL